MLQERAWRAVFFSIEEPTDVNIDGEAASDWTYDEASKRLTVNVSTHPCSETITINFKDKETGIGLMEEGRSQMEDGAIYKQVSTIVNLAGQMVNGKWSNGKWSGIYIQNGKKILIPYKP